MAISTFPLNGIEYSAADFSSFFCTRTSGVYAEDNFGITVTGSGLQATIGSGMAWMRLSPTSGISVKNDSDTVLTFESSDATYPRYDVIALQFSAADSRTALTVIKGETSSAPRIPTPTRTPAVYELFLYAIYRRPGVSIIARSDINDLRYDENYCGLMSDGVKSIPTQVLHDQYYAMLEELQNAGEGGGGETPDASSILLTGYANLIQAPETDIVQTDSVLLGIQKLRAYCRASIGTVEGFNASIDIQSELSASDTIADAISKLYAYTKGRGYGVCNSMAEFGTKGVAIPNFVLQPGAMIAVLFKFGNTASTPTLNVNDTGAKPIYSCYTNTNISSKDIAAEMTAQLVYTGTNWVLLNPMPA